MSFTGGVRRGGPSRARQTDLDKDPTQLNLTRASQGTNQVVVVVVERSRHRKASMQPLRATVYLEVRYLGQGQYPAATPFFLESLAANLRVNTKFARKHFDPTGLP